MGTTPNGYPYPEDTDLVAQGAQAIKALALAVDTRARVSASGKVTVSVGSGAPVANAAVTFPAGRFTAAPVVVAVAEMANAYYFATINTPTASGVTVYARRYNDTLTTASVPVHWTATAGG